MKGNRKNHNPSFKAKVALEALQGEETIVEISSKYEIHPTLVARWKKELKDNAAIIFGEEQSRKKKDEENLIARLYQQIGQLKVEKDFLEGVLRR